MFFNLAFLKFVKFSTRLKIINTTDSTLVKFVRKQNTYQPHTVIRCVTADIVSNVFCCILFIIDTPSFTNPSIYTETENKSNINKNVINKR